MTARGIRRLLEAVGMAISSRRGMAIPLMAPLGLTAYATGAPMPWRVELGPDEVLLMCTDGVVEARGRGDGAFYPLAERAASLVAGSSADLENAISRLYADLLRHVGGRLGDDSVLLLLARS